MTDYLESLDHMFAVWNSTHEAEQDRLAIAALEHNIQFVDPRHNIVGRDAFLRMVRETQAEHPGLRYGRSCEPQMQNNHCRYHWSIHHGDKEVMTGFDVTEVTDAGKIMKVIGFFGELDRSESASG
ncbi:hypothetical protein [Erythrobacter rubeus]|uniref:SnoaL-like domain-containing protein n=1 Tax=Erythrobacter rubeus TaxID=2760803 RepID=A0ABR8KTR5_9SPHN|nr:hypothetical protein [Erythrobacter rubeus]MBD2842608.1 hypothetical protein [Erythrobacter rubeus]